MSEPPRPYWGNLLKSNWNGTYYGLSIDNVNRDDRGYVDFEKMIGLDGIVLINIVSNPADAANSGRKLLQSRITHNDGESCNSASLCTYIEEIQVVLGSRLHPRRKIRWAARMNVIQWYAFDFVAFQETPLTIWYVCRIVHCTFTVTPNDLTLGRPTAVHLSLD